MMSRSFDERALAARFRDGDPDAIREVYEQHVGRVTAVASTVLRDRELVADAVQHTFLNAWRSADSLDADRGLAAWLATIARRAAIDRYRRERRHAHEELDTTNDPIELPPGIERAWEAGEVRAAVDELPVAEREVVRLSHLEGLTHPEIAARLSIPVGTVKSRSSRAHRRLAALLGHLLEVDA